MKQLGRRMECFWDEEFLDAVRTTAEFRVHEPVGREVVLAADTPWEGVCSDFFNFLRDGDRYRMYYLGRTSIQSPIVVCYAESRDGLHWEKPNLGICEFQGSRENNIIMDVEKYGSGIDNFMVFLDDNPDCPPEKKYKAVALYQGVESPKEPQLWCFFSGDGVHFEKGYKITGQGTFDSLNVAFWDAETKKYRAYFRNSHNADGSDFDIAAEGAIRDIRYIESEDFEHWSEPVSLDYGCGVDLIQMYTNNVMPYPWAPHIYFGTPTRYTERKVWTGCYDELCGKEKRLAIMELGKRLGLALTDCAFMCSRDGVHFRRQEEAFLKPLPENGDNWVYGDCYPARGVLETPSEVEGADPEISIYCFEKRLMGLRRYSLRHEGFVSLHAGGKREELVVTKPFCFDGGEMYINFATSARGYLYLALVSKDGKRVESCETFGNSIRRRVAFPEGEVAKLAGQEVVLEVRMLEADLYAMQFGEKE